MNALVDQGGVSGSRNGLEFQLFPDELLRCILALSHADIPSSQMSPVEEFVSAGATRLKSILESLSFARCLELRQALQRCKIPVAKVDADLRRKLQGVVAGGLEERRIGAKATATVVRCSRALSQVDALKSERLRMAVFSEKLAPGAAAGLLAHALPLEGAPLPSHEFLVAMFAGKIAGSPRVLSIREIASACEGALALQARGDAFFTGHAAFVLRALWPHVAKRLEHFRPGELSDVLRAYWWQLQFCSQELAREGTTQSHPILAKLPNADSGQRRRSLQQHHQAVEDLKSKLVWPALGRLGEGTLRHAAACLTTVAPPVRPPDGLDEAERQELRELVAEVFSDGARPRTAAAKKGPEQAWRREFWSNELQRLTPADMLELACGLREAGLKRTDEGGEWLLDDLLAELGRRLQPAGGRTAPRVFVELTHVLLLRMCRVMDLWYRHEVEDVLKHLLSNPEACRQLPTTLFLPILEALRRFSVPRELVLRQVAAFLDRFERGDCEVEPLEWAEMLCLIRPLDELPSWERITPRLIQRVVPHLHALPAGNLLTLLQSLALKPFKDKVETPKVTSTQRPVAPSAMEVAPKAALEAVHASLNAGSWDFAQVVGVLDSLGQLGWFAEATVAAALNHCMQAPLLEPHAPLLLPLVRACAALRVHHGPLLYKVVVWNNWCYTYLRPKPLPKEDLEELLQLAGHLAELAFLSMEMNRLLAENLGNVNASPRQLLVLLSLLARFSHFPAQFKATCMKACAESPESEEGLASLSNADLVEAFNVHLCAVFDGPAALKYWLTEDEDMKTFFQIHTSQKWYQRQDQERTAFLQTEACEQLKQASEELDLKLRPSDPGEVYHMELVSQDARARLAARDGNLPSALVCIKSREQLQWYVPVTAEGASEGVLPEHNRCRQFRFMFRGAVQKLRHLQAMGYRTSTVWMSEWNALTTQQERVECLRAAFGDPDSKRAAFSPSTPEEEEAYR